MGLLSTSRETAQVLLEHIMGPSFTMVLVAAQATQIHISLLNVYLGEDNSQLKEGYKSPPQTQALKDGLHQQGLEKSGIRLNVMKS